MGISGLISIINAYIFARFVGYEREFLKSGYYTYNALLVGLGIGHLFTISPLSLLYISIAAIITFLITVAMSDVYFKFLKLPILSLPFVIVTSLIYLSAAKFSNLYVNELYSQGNVVLWLGIFPYWLEGFLKSMGAIIFMPSPFVGLLLMIMIFIQSRILFLLAVFGYYFGVFLQGTFVGSYYSVFFDLNAFNYPLIAMALGGIFNIPSCKSFTFAFAGVAMGTVLIKSIDIFWSVYGIPVFTLPFLVITFGLIYVLNLLNYKFIPTVYKATPEQTTENFYAQKLRYPQIAPMYLPFCDEWSIYQGFDGEWTHKGISKYAYDFVKRDQRGLTYANEGKKLEDYYCYRKPVCAPCRGYVVYAYDLLPDNPIGVVDTVNNWGNHIIIQDVMGTYVGLCHLAPGSIKVRVGDWVESFQELALCGNTGYSPQPHLHMQYQTTSFLNSMTIPFTFIAVKSGGDIFNHLLPKQGQALSPFFVQTFFYQVTNFVLDEVLTFDFYKNDKFIEKVKMKVKMASDSTFYLEHGQGRLYFGKLYSSFYFYHLDGSDRYLKMLYLAAPSFPLSYAEGSRWKEYVPNVYLNKFTNRIVQEVMSSFNFRYHQNAFYHFESDTVIKGEITCAFVQKTVRTKVILDSYVRFKEIVVEDNRLVASS